ncbi:MAG: Eco57I restriction-modification methylase domain-containing protein [Gammaproteobacteria bacterium]
MPAPANNPVNEEVRAALRAFTPADLRANARALLNALGYSSERTSGLGGSPHNFIAQFPSLPRRAAPTESEKDFRKAANSAHILFQYTDQEIGESVQMNPLEGAAFDRSQAKSFLFIAVELAPGEYARGKYAAMTREISKRFAMPVCVLFENGGRITLAFAHRRESKRPGDTDRDILGKVSLIRDVDCAKPHRAHLQILADLELKDRLGWVERNKKPMNFDGLLLAWQAVLDTEELNKRFYRELFAWFTWAVAAAKFPLPKGKNAPEVSQEDHVIRLITRILFVWFIKEKGLVADELFKEAQIRSLLADYDREKGDDYYRAILQNLFFATLNTEIGKRRFSQRTRNTHRNRNLWRYEDLLADSKAFLHLLKQTPFINGGLFDCLDSEKETRAGGYRLDCFSDNPHHRKLLSVPNRLFFDEKGLFPLLNKYKFTVEENTPIEQEVALDPELLGKVFEKLLTAYSSGTDGTVYTPRPIVDYMVDEALVASLSKKVTPAPGRADLFGERLRHLFNYADAGDAAELFDAREMREIVRAIAQITVLDPAVGSGAFPMGILHKLTFALRRLDPDNKILRKLQADHAGKRSHTAYDREEEAERAAVLQEINDTFSRYTTSDFGRKLYLIQNSIFGVDILPIACLIAKLRFFISLAIEQNPNDDSADNFGIKPLPNLETRFVSADALIGLRVIERNELQSPKIAELQTQLQSNRERHFNARSRQTKNKCRTKDKRFRRKLSEVLESHYRRDADWEAARGIVEAGLEQLRRALAKCQSEQHSTSQGTLLPDSGRTQHDWRETIAALQEKKEVGEKLLESIWHKKPSAKTGEVWRLAEHAAQEQNKRIDTEAQKIAEWDPYDQNATAGWFDPKRMFGITDFDVVIGNPPYVPLSRDGGRLAACYEDCDYEVFDGSGDIYQLFYERGMKLSKDASGMLAFITSNSWMRAGYGKKLRKFFSEQGKPLQLIDVGKDAFPAVVDTNILLVGRGKAGQAFKAVDMDTVPEEGFPPDKKHWRAIRLCGEGAWIVFSPAAASLKSKVEQIGTPLRDWDVQINRGATTGYNDAFIVEQDKRDELVAADPNSADILKSMLRGKDVQRYRSQWADRWLVATVPTMHLNINDYPAVKKYLLEFGKAKLAQEGAALADGSRSRKKTRHKWFELQDSCAYYAEFEKEKLIWKRVGSMLRFAIDRDGHWPLDSTCIITGERVKFLCAVLNSEFGNYLLQDSPTTGMGELIVSVQAIKPIHIPKISADNRRVAGRMEDLVDQILAAKSKTPDADTTALEAEIDQLVYQLYQLTPAEISVVEQARAPA